MALTSETPGRVHRAYRPQPPCELCKFAVPEVSFLVWVELDQAPAGVAQPAFRACADCYASACEHASSFVSRTASPAEYECRLRTYLAFLAQVAGIVEPHTSTN